MRKYFLIIIIAISGFVSVLFYNGSISNSETFSADIIGLQKASDLAEVVTLNNGDEFSLEASYVKKEIGNRVVRMIAYNSSIPGPFIKIEQGGTIKIHFTNNLDIDTTLHSHGIRLDFEFDGTPKVSQEPIKPGETFTYELKFPDSGTYWYHPHIREDYAQEMGLYGNYQVKPIDYTLPVVNETINLIVDDILFEKDEMPPFYKDRTNFAIMGRFGNVMLVNGKTDYEKEFLAGSVVRMNITNTANARPFELHVPGAEMKLVGSDLSPYEKETFIDKILITPSERYIVDVYFPEAGTYKLIHTSHDLAMGKKDYLMGKFIVNEERVKNSNTEEYYTLHSYDWVIEEASEFDSFLYKKPDQEIRFSMDPGKLDFGSAMDKLPCHKMPDGAWMGDCTEEKKQKWLNGLSSEENSVGGEKIHWEDHTYQLNKKTTNKDITWQILDENTGVKNSEINWKYNIGDVIKVRIFNDPMSPHPMQHPFHIHGQRMMTIAVNSKAVDNRVWKDSILVPVGETYDVIIEFSNPGIWMAHCHIAEHLASGMMFDVAVGEEYFELYDNLKNKSH